MYIRASTFRKVSIRANVYLGKCTFGQVYICESDYSGKCTFGQASNVLRESVFRENVVRESSGILHSTVWAISLSALAKEQQANLPVYFPYYPFNAESQAGQL